MCKICVEWQKGKMTSKEAMRAIGEMIGPAEGEENAHYIKLAEQIISKEVPEGSTQDSEIDEEWERKNRGGY